MKKNTIKIIFLTALITLSQSIYGQCLLSHNPSSSNGANNVNNFWGQGFTAECNGFLEYIQFTSFETGTISAGTLNIYNGNTVNGTPIYTQSHPAITINQANEPIRIDLTDDFSLVEGNQYTFEFFVDDVGILADFSAEYNGGSFFQSGNELSFIDSFFAVSISNTSLSVSDFNISDKIRISPNPSSEYIQITSLKTKELYSIYNISGTKIKNGIISNKEYIDIKGISNGLYFLKFSNGNTIKFIKN